MPHMTRQFVAMYNLFKGRFTKDSFSYISLKGTISHYVFRILGTGLLMLLEHGRRARANISSSSSTIIIFCSFLIFCLRVTGNSQSDSFRRITILIVSWSREKGIPCFGRHICFQSFQGFHEKCPHWSSPNSFLRLSRRRLLFQNEYVTHKTFIKPH